MIRIASMVGAPDLNMPTLAPFSGDLANACLQLKKMGFDGIELMSRRPGLLDKTALKQCLAENDLVLVGLCTGHLLLRIIWNWFLPRLRSTSRLLTECGSLSRLRRSSLDLEACLISVAREEWAIRFARKGRWTVFKRRCSNLPTRLRLLESSWLSNRSAVQRPISSTPPRTGLK